MRIRTLASVVAVAALAPILTVAVASAATDTTEPSPPPDTGMVDTTAPPDGTGMVDTTGPDGTMVDTTTPAAEPTMVATTEAAGTLPAEELGELTVGSADFTESQLLAEIYGQTLQAIGYDVSYQHAIGARDAYIGAIEGGEVDLVPEYTGSLLAFLLAPDQPTATTVEEQVAAIGEALPDGLEVLTPSTAEDKDTIVCTQAVVDEHSLTNLSSLFAVAGEITLGAPPEFETRTPFGLAGFSEIYGATFAEFVPLAYSDIPAALESGSIDCGNIFSTNPAIETSGFVPLEDDLNIVPFEAVLPLVRSEVVTPGLVAALDCVNAALDTETLTALMVSVDVDQLGPDVVAADWLATVDCPPAGDAPATTGPASTEPMGTEPGTTEPMGTEPGTTSPSGTEPAGTEPSGTDAPPATEPPGTEPTGS